MKHRGGVYVLVLLLVGALSLTGCGGGGGGGGGASKAGTGRGASASILLGTPASQPAVIPPTANPTQVTFLSMVTGSGRPPKSLQLEEVDAAGNVVSVATQLRDDGQLADLNRGDRIYTGTVTFSEATSMEKNYRVSVVYNGTQVTSQAMNFWISGCPSTSRPSDPAQAVFDQASNSYIFANEVMIRTGDNVPPNLTNINTIAGVAGVGGHVVGCIPASRQYLLEITNPDAPADAAGVYKAIDTLKTQPGIVAAYPNGQSIAEPTSPLNSSLLCTGSFDTDPNCQWYLEKVRARQAWDLAGGGDPQMAVSVIDFGVDCSLNSLPCDASQSNQDPVDHGTGIAGLIASPNNSTGMVGAAFNTYLYPYSFLGSAGSQYKMDELINTSLGQADVRVINISAITGTDFNDQIKTAMCRAISSGRLVVAAAGNPAASSNCQLSAAYPARYSTAGMRCDNGADLQGGLIVVGATDINNQLASWSNDTGQSFCSNQQYVNLYAPGKDIITLSTTDPSGYTTKSGTSYATPLVSAAAAVLWSAHPGYTPRQIHDRLINSASRLSSSTTVTRLQTTDSRVDGKPLLDMYRAVGGVDTIINPDTQPDAFTIPAVTAAELQTEVMSAPITITGIDSPTPITIQGGYYRINDGALTNAAGSVRNNDKVEVELISSTGYITKVFATLYVGNQSQSFEVTTRDMATPGKFTFITQNNVALDTPILSNTQQISNIDPGTPISIEGLNGAQADYAITEQGAVFTNQQGAIDAGQTVQLRLKSPATLGSKAEAVLTIGTISSHFVVTTPMPDTTPDAFWDPPNNGVIDVAPSTAVTTTPFTVSGLNTDTTITISGGTYSLDNGQSYTGDPGIVQNNQAIQVQLTSSDKSSGVAAATLSIGTLSRVFTATTFKFIQTPNDFTFPAKANVATGTVVASDPVQISGINVPVDISIVGSSIAANAQYAISDDGVTFSVPTNVLGQIKPGQYVKVQLTAPDTNNSAVNATLTIGTKTGTFVVSTQGAVTTPNGFTFTPSTIMDVGLDSVQSATTTVSGINADTPINISADIQGSAQYSLDNINFTSNPGTITATDVASSQTVYVHLTAASTPGTANTATLNINNVTSTFTVTTLPAYDIILNNGPPVGGDVSYPTSVLKGQDATIAISVNTGFHITGVTGTANVCNVGASSIDPVTGDTLYPITNITGACTVTVTYALNTYTVTGAASPSGTGTVSTVTGVVHGATTSVAVTANTNYAIDSISGCGGANIGQVDSPYTYNTGTILADCAVTANFVPTHTVTATPATGGTFDVGGTGTNIAKVRDNQSTTVVVTPNPGYATVSVTGDTCTLSTTDQIYYTTNGITSDCTITTTFALVVMHTVTANVGRNGTITPSGAQSIPEGTTAVFTVTPDPNYQIESVTGCNGTLVGDTYTTAPINADCTVIAVFTTLNPTALFPTQGLHWNDYVQGGDMTTATDTACDAAVDTACIHAGEMRAVDVPGITSCTGLTANDALGVFTWVCEFDPNTSEARMVSTGLAQGKHLSDLIDFAAPTWNNNSVTVYSNASPIFTTPSTQWWSNSVLPAGDGSVALSVSGTIYVVSADTILAAGYVVSASKVGLVGKSNPKITISGPGNAADAISLLNVDFVWVEGQVDATGDYRGVHASTNFTRFDNLIVNNAARNGVDVVDSNYISFSDIQASNNGLNGVGLTTSSYNTLTNIYTNGNTSSGVVLSSSSYNTLSDITVSSHINSYGLSLSNSLNNKVSRVTATNNYYGVVVYYFSNSNTLSDIVAERNNFSGVELHDVSYNSVTRVSAYFNDSGFTFNNSAYNDVSYVNVPNNRIGIESGFASNHNKLTNIIATNNSNYGIEFATNSNSVISKAFVSNNDYAGVIVRSLSTDVTYNNTFLDMIISNNPIGVDLDSTTNNIFTGITLSNNGKGILTESTSAASTTNSNIVNAATISNNTNGISLTTGSYSTITNILAANNNNGILFDIGSSNTTIIDTTASHNTIGISVNDSDNNRFFDVVQVGGNDTDCQIVQNTAVNPGIAVTVDSPCAPQGDSNFTLYTGVILDTSFVGKVTADAVNQSAINGGADVYPADPATFDWSSFENPFRAWGIDGSVFPNVDQQGQWIIDSVTGTSPLGRIWDWSLLSQAPATTGPIWNIMPLPSGSDTITHAWSGTPVTTDNVGCDALVASSTYNGTSGLCETTFLKHAWEILNDGIGNDNGLCESNETCLYTPNQGSYQGHGNLISAGTFVDGTLSGITLLQYDTNGYPP